MTTNLEVVFDNGGGITVQCDEYAHSYSEHVDFEKDAARDVAELLDGADPADWDGNDDDARIPTYTNLRNGGYKAFDADDLTVQRSTTEPLVGTGWHNVDKFMSALTGRTVKD